MYTVTSFKHYTYLKHCNTPTRMTTRDKLPWEVELSSPEEGRQAAVTTFVVCCAGHITLLAFILPASVTFFSTNKIVARPLNRLSIKCISLVFDTIAVVGAIKELVETTPSFFSLSTSSSNTHDFYSFSTHAEFHASVTCGYFAWAAFATVLFGDVR